MLLLVICLYLFRFVLYVIRISSSSRLIFYLVCFTRPHLELLLLSKLIQFVFFWVKQIKMYANNNFLFDIFWAGWNHQKMIIFITIFLFLFSSKFFNFAVPSFLYVSFSFLFWSIINWFSDCLVRVFSAICLRCANPA